MKKMIASALVIVAGSAFTMTALAAETHVHDSVDGLIDLALASPKDADIRVRIGSMLLQSGDDAAAQVWFDEAEALDPKRTDLNDAGVIYDEVTVRGVFGPDVWVCSLPNAATYTPNGGFQAYSIATTSANAGDVNLSWFPNPNNLHPVIGQNLYRWYQGVFSQVGQSWLKHGFCALQNSGCGSCQPAGGGCPPLLGPGCADPYSAGLNGSQGRLGPKHEVNPTTGIFPGNHSTPSGGNTNRGRLLVATADAIPSSSGAEYWVEGQYIHAEDSQITPQGASLNNVTHARVSSMSGNSNRSLGSFTTQYQQEPAIFSWQRVDPSVVLQLVEADGYFHVGGSATDIGGGDWMYQYNIFNLDSNGGVDDLTVNFGAGVNVSSSTFNSPGWHSGSFYDNTAWASGTSADGYNFTVQNKGVNDNRVRWATMYTFTFVADSGPVDGTVTMNVPGSGTYEVALPVPEGGACVGDFDGSGAVDSGDLATLLAAWGTPGGDLDGSGGTDSADLAVLLAAWGPC